MGNCGGVAGVGKVKAMEDRLTFKHIPPTTPQTDLCRAVVSGLASDPKTLPSWLLYDDAGSDLFERITELPEYYLTRLEQQILESRAEEILEAAGGERQVVEFGSGSSRKTRLLLEALLRKQGTVSYVPIDISREFLHESAQALLVDYPRLRVRALAAEYQDALDSLRHEDIPRLFLFLGSNIGNFEPAAAEAFLAGLAGRMRPDGRLLLGLDLVKDLDVLLAAYNDAEGITAAFNKNLLVRINRELDANFDPDDFRHEAPFNPLESRMEMHLVARRPHRVRLAVPGVEISFEEGESIHTENSYKYTVDGFESLARRAGLAFERVWTDPDRWFALVLLKPIA